MQQLFDLKTTLTDLTFSPDGRFLAVCGYRGLVQVWDAVSGEQVRRLPGCTQALHHVFFTANGTGLLAKEGHRLLTWDLSQANPAAVPYPAATWAGFALSPD